jgi:hypothetical protein
MVVYAFIAFHFLNLYKIKKTEQSTYFATLALALLSDFSDFSELLTAGVGVGAGGLGVYGLLRAPLRAMFLRFLTITSIVGKVVPWALFK